LDCRLAKAYGLARLPGRIADTLDWIWHTNLRNQITLFGGSALFAYEGVSGVLAPARLARDEHMQFIVHSAVGLDLEELAEACGEGTRVGGEDHRILICAGDRLLCEVFQREFFLTRLDDRAARTLEEAFELPRFKSLTVSRDCRPTALTATDPRTYALAAFCLAGDNDTWAERAEFAVQMIDDFWPDKFDEYPRGAISTTDSAGWQRSLRR
jgi:hypothetical protein